MKYDIKKPIQIRIDELDAEGEKLRKEGQWDDSDQRLFAIDELKELLCMIENLEEGGLL